MCVRSSLKDYILQSVDCIEPYRNIFTGTAARAITWGTSFEASTIALPTTTVTTARLDVAFIYNTVSSKWRCVGTC